MKPSAPAPAAAINWSEVRARLARAMAATEEAHRPSPQRAREIMDQRARRLARPLDATAAAGAALEILTFSLGPECYAVETRFVHRVVPLTDFTPLPGAPPFLVGVMNLHGQILAVVDLRKFFGVPERGLTDLTRVVILGGERPEFGVLADAAAEVLELRRGEVLEPPGSVAGVAREYLSGVTEGALLVLDGAVLLQDPRLFIDQGDEPGA